MHGVEVLVVLVGLCVAVGTPLGTYFAARKGHESSERVAERAAETARTVAVAAAEAAREEHDRSHIRWACEKAWSSDPATRSGGIAILQSMFQDNQLDHADLVAIAGVLDSLTRDAINRTGVPAQESVAAPHVEGDADGSSSERGGGR